MMGQTRIIIMENCNVSIFQKGILQHQHDISCRIHFLLSIYGNIPCSGSDYFHYLIVSIQHTMIVFK